ncbi:HLA class II histocompatibility antigen, DR beta 4 chain, partial [Sarracenia purpurea var. burkii]
KEGLENPIYDTIHCESPHAPIFLSTVEIFDQSFDGEPAKRKKQKAIRAEWFSQAQMAALSCTSFLRFTGSPSKDWSKISTVDKKIGKCGDPQWIVS